jgi:hypothetical protein
LHTVASTTEPPGKRIVLRYVVDGLDAESDQLRDLAGVDSGKSKDVIVGKRRIAVVKELAGDWLGAMPSNSDSRSFGHLKNTKLGAKLSRKLVLHSQDSPSDIPDLEETVWVDAAAFIHVFTINMG